jgi:cytoskeletal protein CcmA (bactofilin family)
MTIAIGRAFEIAGDVDSDEDVTIEGRVTGTIWTSGRAVTVAPAGAVVGEIVAREITVHGFVTGNLIASEVVDIRATAHVSGRVVAGRFILETGAWFDGTVAPQQLTAALLVARYRHDHGLARAPGHRHTSSGIAAF